MAAVESIGVSCGHRVPREPISDGTRKLYWCAECGAYRMSGGKTTGERGHDWALQLREVVADLEDVEGRPLTITVDKPLTAHGQRLADSLGVRVEVRPVSDIAVDPVRRNSTVRTEGHYDVPGPSFAPSDGPRADWIDYRASIGRVHVREQNGDEPLTCPGCGTETDVTDVVHSPKCSTLATATAAPAVPEPSPTEGDLMPEVVCKIDGCENVAVDQRGMYAHLCETHKAEARTQRAESPPLARSSQPGGASLANQARKLVPLATKLERARAQLEALPEQSSAKSAFDEASRRASQSPTPENLARVGETLKQLLTTAPKRTKLENDVSSAERALGLALQTFVREARAA